MGLGGEVRATGLPSLASASWGTHLCELYETPDDRVATVVPYLAAGLGGGERCVWITSSIEDAHRALGRAVPDLERALEDGDLEIHAPDEWYVRDGRCLDVDAILAEWVAREGAALDLGRAGLRITGDVGFVPPERWRSLVAYEQRIDEVLGRHRILALCTYPLATGSPVAATDVVAAHDGAIVQRPEGWSYVESGRADRIAREHEIALGLRDDFLAIASHELKTPLASLRAWIDGLLRAARRGAIDPADLELRLERARTQCDRLDRLATSLLDATRCDPDETRLSLHDVDLVEITATILSGFDEDARRAGCALRISAPSALRDLFDRVRVEQILANLIANALRYAPGTPIEVSIARLPGRARIVVRDEGPGVPPSDRARIFERFAQGTTAHRGGFGVGLWIVRRLAQAMGGDVRLQETERGAAFAVELPLSITLA